ncbi:GreA/GreB family elongation factor [Candidatus Laterigemmans baculatus]|uniref:GreA/GreB family elongation factor n=1 Tax=Candidatus Laterigemmans baculatus TaxID=2770505 RepID=UPI0013DB24C1|nr:GreA/GreB family elongation factor [Candidatus Laterigemmans baculatus]
MLRKKIVANRIITTVNDHRRLKSLLSDGFTRALADKPYLNDLRDELENAEIVTPGDLPPDVVTMKSVVRIREVGSDEIETYQLVYPEEADVAGGKLSILAPIGAAILGYRAGDIVEVRVPRGATRIMIIEIDSQPDRSAAVA